MPIQVGHTRDDVAEMAADHIAQLLQEIAGPATLGLAGGSTPRATYAALATRDVAWDQVTMWLGDERWVAHHHPQSNIGMVRETIVDQVNGRLLAPDYGIGDPTAVAAAYETALHSAFVDRGRGPAPDVVVLGLGADGHTASLFPGTTALDDFANHYVANWVASVEAWRLTATLPLLWSATELVFIVTGPAKAGVVKEIVTDAAPYPAQQVVASARRVTWFLDAAAAARLD